MAAPFILATAPPASAALKNLPYKLLPVKQLGSGQKTAQREQFVKRVEATILKVRHAASAAVLWGTFKHRPRLHRQHGHGAALPLGNT